jgi:formylmethanofuran dehydrogenase subunit E
VEGRCAQFLFRTTYRKTSIKKKQLPKMKCSNCGSTSNPIVDADVTGPISVCVNCYSDQQIVEKHRKKFIKCDNCGCGLPPNQAVDTPKGKLCRDCSVNYSKCKNYDDCHSYLTRIY